MLWLAYLVPLVFTGAGLVFSVYYSNRTARSSASREWVDQLEKRVELCEGDRDRLHERAQQHDREAATLREQINQLRDREIYLAMKLAERGDVA